MAHYKLFIVLLMAALLRIPAVAAQESAAPEAGDRQPATAQGAADSKAAVAEFQASFAAWKEAIQGIDRLRVEYQTADEAQRQELQQELQKRFDAANAMVPGVIEAALIAYDATGGKDEELTQFLVAVAWQRINSDRYEEALAAIEPLVASDVEQPGVALWGAVAAFSLADYEAARKYFAEAEAAGTLTAPPQEGEMAMQLWQLGVGLREILDAHQEAWQREQELRAEEAAADDLPRVVLQTTKGDIVLELFENQAAGTVKNFITLVEKGTYDGTAFHRVLPNFMAQGGDPATAGEAPLNYTIPCECYEPDARKHFRGTISMAHAGRDTGNAQFFLTFRPTPHLDGRTFYPQSTNDAHTVFGRIIEGMEVLADLNRIDPMAPPQVQAAQPEPDRITSAKVLRKRPGTDYGDFTKLER